MCPRIHFSESHQSQGPPGPLSNPQGLTRQNKQTHGNIQKSFTSASMHHCVYSWNKTQADTDPSKKLNTSYPSWGLANSLWCSESVCTQERQSLIQLLTQAPYHHLVQQKKTKKRRNGSEAVFSHSLPLPNH